MLAVGDLLKKVVHRHRLAFPGGAIEFPSRSIALLAPEYMFPNRAMIGVGLHFRGFPRRDEPAAVTSNRGHDTFVLHAREHRIGFESATTLAANQPFQQTRILQKNPGKSD